MANKKVNNIKNVNATKEETDEITTKKLIKTALVVLIVFGAISGLFLLLGKIGMFDEGYKKPTVEPAEFTYNTAMIGTVFNRPESVYYVAFNEEDENEYFNSLLNLYKGGTKIYNVNMSLGINASHKGDNSNRKAKNASELVISTPTLIKIQDGKIVKYLEDIKEIEKELGK